MPRVAKLVANDLKSGDFWLGPFRGDVRSLLRLWHCGLGVIIEILHARSLCGAKFGGLICHTIEPARATMASAAVPFVQGRLDRRVRFWVEIQEFNKRSRAF